ncbi:MAG: SpoIID/LytB domain-containing protein [Nitrospinae bacterium]|nr:SpoIID/LytB domain-containing protein [Nitrospinota bacterium]
MWKIRRSPMVQAQHRSCWRGGWLALCLATLWLLFPLLARAATVPMRVLLLQNISTLHVDVPPEYTILTDPAGLLAPEADGWRALHLHASRNRIRLHSPGIELNDVRLKPRTRDAVIFVGGKLYRGGLEVKARDNGLLVINTLDLDEYLYGVLPQEAPVQWEMAALRAQAIVARTYALYKRKLNAHNDYDVSAHYLQDQRYDGYRAEHPRATQAVDETRGLVLTCHGALIPAYYHAEAGGHTESSEYVWSSAHPCLRAVKAPIYPASPYLEWSVTLSLQDIRAALAKKGYSLGAIRHLQPLQRSPTGRIVLLKIIHTRGESVLRGVDFRLALGPEVIRSTSFSVDIHGERASFTGQGWGHGVGLCQWCSQGMAQLGYDHEAILKHYYQGADLIQYQ